MANPLDVAARLRAAKEGGALRLGRVAAHALAPNPLIFVGLSLAGEDAALHAVKFGPLEGEPLIFDAIINPRRRDAQYELFTKLAWIFERYMAEAAQSGRHPQIVVANATAAEHLRYLADRTTHLKVPSTEPSEKLAQGEIVRMFGTLLSYFTDRLSVPRQQALLSAASLLKAVYVTGESPEEEEHLRVLQAWIEPLPPGVDAFDYRAAQAKRPSSTKTTTESDRLIMRRLAQARALKDNEDDASRSSVAVAHAEILSCLRGTVEEIDEVVRWAVRHVQGLALPRLRHIEEADAAESDAFRDFMKSREEGHAIRRRDTPRQAATEYAYRTSEEQIVRASMVEYDPVDRARAVLDGVVLRGDVTRVSFGELVIASKQPHVRARVNDSVIGPDGRDYPVKSVVPTEAGVEVTLVVKEATIGHPALGRTYDFLPERAWFEGSKRARMNAAWRTKNPHWAYDEDAPFLARVPRARPKSPLAELAKCK